MDFKYPLGKGLRDEMIEVMRSQLLRASVGSTVMYPLKQLNRLADFEQRLSRGGYMSPDAFLEKHTDFLDMGRFLIAWCLKRREIPDNLFPPRGWHERLVDALVSGADSPRQFQKNQLSIVTYNYDRTIDYFLHQLVQHRYGLSSAKAWNLVSRTIPIVHLHGMLGEYPKHGYDVDDSVVNVHQLSRRIRIIHEVDGTSDEFQKADELLRNASRIFMVGFSMADANMKRLRFFKHSKAMTSKCVSMLCAVGNMKYMDRRSLWERIAKYNLAPSNVSYTTATRFFAERVRLDGP